MKCLAHAATEVAESRVWPCMPRMSEAPIADARNGLSPNVSNLHMCTTRVTHHTRRSSCSVRFARALASIPRPLSLHGTHSWHYVHTHVRAHSGLRTGPRMGAKTQGSAAARVSLAVTLPHTLACAVSKEAATLIWCGKIVAPRTYACVRHGRVTATCTDVRQRQGYACA